MATHGRFRSGLALMRTLETKGARVLNGADAFALELSKTAQAALMRVLGVTGPRSLTFNSLAAVRARAHEVGFPALVKPDQGGSGARIFRADSLEDVERLLEQRDDIWFPDNLLLLQEYVPYDEATGIIRMEFLGGKLLYAMRVVSHGAFNLCPSPACNPEDGSAGVCEIPAPTTDKPVEFYPYPEVPSEAVDTGLQTDPCRTRSTSAESSISTRRTAGASSTTSTRIPTFAQVSRPRLDSIRSSASWTISKSRFVHPASTRARQQR